MLGEILVSEHTGLQCNQEFMPLCYFTLANLCPNKTYFGILFHSKQFTVLLLSTLATDMEFSCLESFQSQAQAPTIGPGQLKQLLQGYIVRRHILSNEIWNHLESNFF